MLLLSLLCQQPIQSIHQSSKPWILHREKYPQHFKIKTWTSSIQLFKWSSTWNRIKMNLMDTHYPLSIAVLCLPKFVFFLHNKMYSLFVPVASCSPEFISWCSSIGEDRKWIQMLVSTFLYLLQKQTQFKEQIWTSGSGFEFRRRKKQMCKLLLLSAQASQVHLFRTFTERAINFYCLMILHIIMWTIIALSFLSSLV